MALIECYECGKKISDKAIACPSCGAPLSESHISNEPESTPTNKKTDSHVDAPLETTSHEISTGMVDIEKLANVCHKPVKGDSTSKNTCCPNCGSEDWKSASMVYNEGIHNISTDTKSAGFGISSSGSLGVGIGNSKTKGVVQNEISSKLTPPPSPPPTNLIHPYNTLIAIAIVILSVLVGNKYFGTIAAILAFYFAFFGPFDVSSMKKLDNMKKYEMEVERWKNTRVCLRCGRIYVNSQPH